MILVVGDVTEQARVEGELIRMEKLATVGEMVNTVNHKINTTRHHLYECTVSSTHEQRTRRQVEKKLERIENQVNGSPTRLSTMEEVSSSEYIADGPSMVDIWGKTDEADGDMKNLVGDE